MTLRFLAFSLQNAGRYIICDKELIGNTHQLIRCKIIPLQPSLTCEANRHLGILDVRVNMYQDI